MKDKEQSCERTNRTWLLTLMRIMGSSSGGGVRLADFSLTTAFASPLVVAFLVFPEGPSPTSLTSESDSELSKNEREG